MSNWSPQSVAEIAATQRELIDSAFHALAPGGVMVYSTCTLNAQENQQVVRWLLDTYGDAVSVEPLGALFPGADKALTAEGFLHVFPQIYDSEGFSSPACANSAPWRRWRSRPTRWVNSRSARCPAKRRRWSPSRRRIRLNLGR